MKARGGNTASPANPGLGKRYADFVARLRVPVGFLLVGAFAWFSQPTLFSVFLGGTLALPGLALRGWAAGHLRKNSTLTKSGPYRFVRNPLYAGTLIAAMGFAVAAWRWELALLFALVFGFIYFPAIALEEQHLRKLFAEFGSYAERVPLLIPYREPLEPSAPFAWSQYIHNREYEAGLGFFVGIVFLYGKALYLMA